MKLTIPRSAKNAARKGLRERETFANPPGLTSTEAKRLGIQSGVSRAKQLITKDTLNREDASSVARFYGRFKNCRTPRCETALNLWGGRAFGRRASQFIHKRKP